MLSYEVFPSVIRSSARLSYDQAQAILDSYHQKKPIDQINEAVSSCEVPHGSIPLSLEVLEKLQQRIVGLDFIAKAMFEHRKKDGCMDFDRVEAKVKLDSNRNPLEIVAEWLLGKNLPCVFRVHDAPDGDALRSLYAVLREFPLFNDIDKRLFCDGNPQTLQEILERVSGHPLQELVNTLLLRAMKRAVYRAEQDFHYGLALDTYCHFTSPIRRYPDLLVHRMLKEGFFGKSETFEAQRNGTKSGKGCAPISAC